MNIFRDNDTHTYNLDESGNWRNSSCHVGNVKYNIVRNSDGFIKSISTDEDEFYYYSMTFECDANNRVCELSAAGKYSEYYCTYIYDDAGKLEEVRYQDSGMLYGAPCEEGVVKVEYIDFDKYGNWLSRKLTVNYKRSKSFF